MYINEVLEYTSKHIFGYAVYKPTVFEFSLLLGIILIDLNKTFDTADP